MSGVQGASEAVRQPVHVQAEWTVDRQPLEFALDALNTASAYFAATAHPVATGLGFFMTWPGRSYRSLDLRSAVCDSEEKIKNEISKRHDLLGSLAWKSLALGAIYLDSQSPERGISMGSVLAFLAGSHLCTTLARRLVSPSAIYVREEVELSEIPAVTCTIHTEDGTTVYEASL